MQKNYDYGVGDSSYQAAGCLEGLTRLVDLFYEHVNTLPEAEIIRKLYPEDLSSSRKKLTFFLSGWLGGPRIYQEHFGSINIPGSHVHMKIGAQEQDAWLFCMDKAVQQQAYTQEFKQYLMEQLSIPAEKIRIICQKAKENKFSGSV
jgi:hemoglobin